MKRILKALIAGLLVIAQISGMAVFAQIENPDSRGGLLINMGIADEKSYEEDNIVSRIEFIDLVLKMTDAYAIPVSSENGQLFFDVPKEDDCYEASGLAVLHGLIKGGADGYLRPYNPVTRDEAVTIIARALKCEELIAEFDGVIYFATRMGLFKNVKFSENGTLTYRNAVELLYNALCAPKIESVSGGDYRLTENSSYMGEIYDLKYEEGVVDGNYKWNLYDEIPLEYGYITVNGEKYSVKNDVYNELYFGMAVTAYYTEDKIGNRKIVYIDAIKNDVLELDAEAVEAYNGVNIEYTDEKSNKVKTLNVSSKASTVHNGVRINVSGYMELPKYGSFMLIDHNSDRIYDVVLIKSYAIRVVKEVSPDEKSLYFIENSNAVNFEDYDNVYLTDAEGNPISVSGFLEYNIAEISASSDKRYIEIKIISEKVNMVVASVKSSRDDYITVKDTEGNTLRTILDFGDDITIGKNYVFALDSKGYIAAVVSGEYASDYKIGYVVGVAPQGAFEDYSLVKIYDTEGVFSEFVIKDGLRYINESRKMSLLEAETKLPGQLIRFNEKDGIIKRVELASESQKYEGLRKLATLPDARSIASRYYSSTSLLGGKLAIDSNTVIMMVPPDSERGAEDGYRIDKKTILINQQYYPNSTGYKIGTDGFNTDVVVIKGLTATLNKDSNLMLITEISETVDPATEDIKIKLKGFVAGEETELFLDNEELGIYASANGDSVELEAGDFIRYAIDYKNEICVLKLMYDCSEEKIYGNGDTEDVSALYGDPMVHRKGQVLRKGGMYLSLLLHGETESSGYLYPVTSGTRLYQVTETHNGKEFEVITINDIKTLENDAGLEDKFFAYMAYQTMQVFVVYSKL